MKQIIINGYGNAGDDFLALKLKKVFTVLETPEEVALHNDMVKDIQAMIGDYDDFGKSVARIILGRPKDFLLRLASLIRNRSIRDK